ncbi:MAG TPA: FAD-dependent oxidoreductase, partial [Ilumatobacteraceae bacterium]|nr:FAD-dependent oxidoreductase [Ilumatobacteraceae bacterium]
PLPIFATPTAGMAALTGALGEAITALGVDIRLGTTVGELRRGNAAGTGAVGSGRWMVDGEAYDAVVVASPAKPSAPLLAATSGDAAGLLAAYDHAGVVMVTLAVPD